MASDANNSGDTPPPADAKHARPWGELWQAPALLAGVGLFVGGVAYSVLTKPKVERVLPFEQVEELLAREEYQQAIDELNTKILPFLNAEAGAEEHGHAGGNDSGHGSGHGKPKAGEHHGAGAAKEGDHGESGDHGGNKEAQEKARYHMLLARAIRIGQDANKIDLPENHEVIVRQYEQAMELGATLRTSDTTSYAASLAALGRTDEAIRAADAFPLEAHDQKVALYRGVIDRGMRSTGDSRDEALSLLVRLLNDPNLSLDDRAWAIARQAEEQLTSGYADAVVTRLLRELPRLSGAGAMIRGEMLLLLGRAYVALDEPREAAVQLERASKLLPHSDPRSGKAMLLLAKANESLGDPASVQALYDDVLARFPETSLEPRALLGRAEALADQGEHELAHETYDDLIRLLRGELRTPRSDEAHGNEDEGTKEGAAHGEPAPEHQDGDASSKPSADSEPHAEESHSGDSHAKDQHAGDSPEKGSYKGESAPGHGGPKAGPPEFDDGLAPPLDPEEVERSLLSRYRERFDSSDIERARSLTDLGLRLRGMQDASDELLLAAATVRRRAADDLLQVATGGTAPPDPLDVVAWLADLDPSTQRQARSLYQEAGVYYREHARRMLLTDANEYGASLWMGADSFDRAGDSEAAIDALNEFATGFPDDPRRFEASFRLARATQALGDFASAAKFYQEVIDARDESSGNASAGPVADRSFVPLAQVLLVDANPENDTRAVELLRRVVRGEVVGPETELFSQALVLLGDSAVSDGRIDEAIQSYEEALARSGTDRTVRGVPFKLAEAYRARAAMDAERLETAMADAERRTLSLERAQRLRRAMELYEQTRAELQAKDARRRSGLEELRLRNSSFYLGDCAMDLGDYDAAIEFYQAARERYPTDPSSLVALTQIVNAHLRQGDRKKAATAHTRAKRFFESLPDSVWSDPNLPMSKEVWKRWLDASFELEGDKESQVASGEAGAGS
ncbi:MAG: tetratricopeptide repeat protein [Planctomycetota bacterium]|nr:tetratricopeptide repeat protein [Planctomycetota bacterium]